MICCLVVCRSKLFCFAPANGSWYSFVFYQAVHNMLLWCALFVLFLVGWLVGLFDWLIGWLVGWLVVHSVDRFDFFDVI